MTRENKVLFMTIGLGFLLLVISMYIFPIYNVWKAKLHGEAIYARAEQERRVLVTQAQAEKDAATLRAQAIEIVGAMAQKYPQYRQQEFIGSFAKAMENGNIQKIIYVPTEANIPIVEVKQ